MTAEAIVATNVKSITQGANQPGTWKVVDDEGNVIFHIDKDNTRIDIGYNRGWGFILRVLKALHIWEIKFIRNTAVTISEHYGILCRLPESTGTYRLAIQNGNWQDVFELRNDAHLYMQPSADTTNNLKAGIVHYDSATNKLKFYTGSAWETVTSG